MNHTPTPYEILVGMSPDGRVGIRTLEAALNHGEWDVKQFVVRAVYAHEELVEKLRLISEAMNTAVDNDEYWNRGQMRSHLFQVQSLVEQAIAKAEGRL